MAMNPLFSKTRRESSQPPLAENIDEPSLSETSGFVKNALSGFLAARIELASIEAKEAATYASRKVVHGVVLGISLFFVWALVLAGLTGVLAPLATGWLAGKIDWLPGWAAVLFGLAALHTVVALTCVVLLKKKPAAPLFELSRQEIENDKQWLKKNK